MQCPETSAPSPSKIQNEVYSALPTSSKRRRLVSKVWNDFKRVEVDGECWALCTHCRKHFSGSSKTGTILKKSLVKMFCFKISYSLEDGNSKANFYLKFCFQYWNYDNRSNLEWLWSWHCRGLGLWEGMIGKSYKDVSTISFIKNLRSFYICLLCTP